MKNQQKKLLKLIIWLEKLILRPFYRLNLKLSAWLHGGTILIEKKIKQHVPVRFQGLGTLKLGNRVQLGYRMAGANNSPILFQPRERNSRIIIGEKTSIMNGCELISRSLIEIGSHCLIGSQVKIFDADFHGIHPEKRSESGISQQVTIEDNVWIGINSIILKGVTIGRNSVIGAGSVVTRNIPKNSIAAGNPAKVISNVYND